MDSSPGGFARAPDDNDVAEFIDERDLPTLRRFWNNDERFINVAMHVTSCFYCLQRRREMLMSWAPSGSPPHGVP